MAPISIKISSDFTIRRDPPIPFRKGKERGFVLVVMAITSVALIGALGLAVDIGRMFITKNETQAYCDSAALAAALALDGTTTGITSAQAAVSNSKNSWNFGSAVVSNPTTTFATDIAGPWLASPNPASGYVYAKVAAVVPMQLYFLPIFTTQYKQNVASAAIAAQVAITSFPRGLAPYTAVSTNPVGPNFGLTIGDSYDIQWPAFSPARAGCNPGNPDKCFIRPPCTGESATSKTAVVTSWGANNSGYWGSNSNSIIQQEILDLIQLQPLDVGANMTPSLSNGDKASEAVYLDQRVNGDVNTTDNTVGGYLASIHNGRRLIPVPIVNPQDPTHTIVIGYGQFLLLANGPGTSNYYKSTANGNDAYCAIYAGIYIVGGSGPGAGGSTGASSVKLVQ
jgi:Flp pilus assembly protein TadG